MKSSPPQLRRRGYVETEEIEVYRSTAFESLLIYLHAKDAYLRTIAAKLLLVYRTKETIAHLCQQLSYESKLYSKLAITETLAQIGELAIPSLIPLLGSIGKNQYTSIPSKPFKKKSYPLPRDIIARTLIRIGELALPALEKVLLIGTRSQILEALDAIGYITFYSNNYRSLPILWKFFSKWINDPLIFWKFVRCLGAFPKPEVHIFLKNILHNPHNYSIKSEITRSIDQVSQHLS